MLVVFTEKKIASDDFIFMAYKKYCQIFNKRVENFQIVREGKPYFSAEGKRANVYFSLTHSGEYIFVAVSNQTVGIDLQIYDKKNICDTAKILFGQDNMSEKECYDRFVAGEAHVKYAEVGLITGLKQDNKAKNYQLLKNYSFAIESEDKGVYFMEL